MHGRVEERVAPFAGAFGGVHGDVGVAHEVFGDDPTALAHGDADARPDHDLRVGQRDRRRKLGDDTRSDLGGFGLAAQVFEQHGELVAAQPSHGVDAAHAFLEAPGDRGQHLVAGGVAPAVVDGLEVVEVDEEQAERRLAALAARQGVTQAVAQQRQVAQAGEGVVIGLVRQLLFERLALGHVTAGEHQPADLRMVDHVRAHRLDLAVGRSRRRRRQWRDEVGRAGARIRPGTARPGRRRLCGPVAERRAHELVGGIAQDAFDRGAAVARWWRRAARP